MIALTFGSSGQDGIFLRELCKKKNIDFIGVSRSGVQKDLQLDISNYEQVESLVRQYKPDYIFHLAANSTTHHSALLENHATISTGTLNILEATRIHSAHSRVFITGSGVQFKNTGDAISEKSQFDASSAYAVARIHSVYASRYYRTLGIRVYVGYLFHHESPYRKPDHVSQLIVSAANRIKNGSNEKILLGDISVLKEWTYAGDVVDGVFALMEQESVFEATIGSGCTYSIQDWLECCFGRVGKDWRDYVELREQFVPEYKCLVSNPETIKSLGWTPKVSFEELSDMMMKF